MATAKKTRKVKLTCVMKGIYHADGGIHVFRRPWRHQDTPWLVQWEDALSCRHAKWFATLAEVRDYLDRGY